MVWLPNAIRTTVHVRVDDALILPTARTEILVAFLSKYALEKVVGVIILRYKAQQ